MTKFNKKQSVNLENLLKIIDFLPDYSEKQQWCVWKIFMKGHDTADIIQKGTNIRMLRAILDYSPEAGKIQKQASRKLEELFDALSTNPPETLKERAKYLRLLIRLAIIAY